MTKMAKALAKRLAQFDGRVAKIGWLSSSKYDDGITVAEVAMIQEFGAPGAGIPPRPFFRPTIEQNNEKWQATIAKGVRAVAAGRTTADQVLDAVGGMAAGQIRQAISNVRTPPLAASTIKQRVKDGRTDQPLNRTGQMIATLIHQVGNIDGE